MTTEEQLFKLQTKISELESRVADTRYFIETALCHETKQIYQGTLTELTRNLSSLYQLREQLSKK